MGILRGGFKNHLCQFLGHLGLKYLVCVSQKGSRRGFYSVISTAMLPYL